jgi:hypothetical protein
MNRMKEFVLPADPFWLLRVPVKQGECVPFHLFLWWRWQFYVRTQGTA